MLGLIAHRQPSHAASQGTLIEQPEPADRGGFMARAYRMMREAVQNGDQSYGAVIVRSGRIVGQAPSRVVVNEDPTAHAEMEAIRDAARRLDTRDLQGCVMYSSSPPCRCAKPLPTGQASTGYFTGRTLSIGGHQDQCVVERVWLGQQGGKAASRQRGAVHTKCRKPAGIL